MARYFLWTFILNSILSSTQAWSQNLIPNPGFENYHAKPCGIISTDNGSGVEDFLSNWRTPTSGSSDVWFSDTTMACYNSIFQGGKPIPRNGKFCAGIYTSNAMFNTYQNLSDVMEYREYLQTRLTKPLTKGKAYYLEYYVQRVFTSSLATNGFGAVLSTVPIGDIIPNKYPVLRDKAQLISKEIVSDTAKWTKISGCFIATMSFEYLTIGNFLDDQQTSFRPTYYKALQPYYLVDDVSLIELDITSIPETGFLGENQTLCEGSNKIYDLGQISPFTVTWQDGSHSNPYNISLPGDYIAAIAYEGCVVTDTVKINVDSKIDLGPDIKVCRSEPVVLQARSREEVLWQNEIKAVEYSPKQSGIFFAKSLSEQCPSQDSVQVDFYTCPGNIPNVFTPNGDGKNDYFFIDNITIIPWSLEIYNRWGKKVYQHSSYDNSWNGGELVNGQYYYRLSTENLGQSFKGWVNILR